MIGGEISVNDNVAKIKELISCLNKYRDHYYNKNVSLITDYEYDRLFDELKLLEDSTGIILSNSPTQSTGYEVKSSLEKVKHSHLMLSLDKTKQVSDLKKFVGDQICLLSLKLDGLTVLLTYDNGKLIQAETRGNGEEGEIVTHNARVFENIPLKIDYKGRLEVEGEAIITYEDFKRVNEQIKNPDDLYRNPRNLVSGSVRQLDSSIAAQRHIRFIAWKVPTKIHPKKSLLYGLRFIENLGFDIVPLVHISPNDSQKKIEYYIKRLKQEAINNDYPIDGLVMAYNDMNYGESLGHTGHHPKHSLAFKFYDEVVETTLKDIEFTMGKTGTLTPTAIFSPVEIDGTIVEKASLHNINVMYETLGNTPYIGQKINVFKSNMIIPQVADADKTPCNNQDLILNYPSKCPICGCDTKLQQTSDTKTLVCTNDDCKGKLLGKLTHFVSKNAMNIDGLSESTLEKLIELNFVESFIDIYELRYNYYNELVDFSGFGKRSVNKLIDAIEKSKNTTLDRFIYALCIPLIGRSASKTISKYFDGSFDRFYNEGCLKYFVFENLDDFGVSMSDSMRKYLNDNIEMIKELAGYLTFQTVQKTNASAANLSGKTFVITGSLNTFENRDVAKEWIEASGGKIAGSISAKTSYLINNDINSSSGKNKKAKELGVPIITEEELLNMIHQQ